MAVPPCNTRTAYNVPGHWHAHAYGEPRTHGLNTFHRACLTAQLAQEHADVHARVRST